MSQVVFDISMSVDGFVTNAAGVPEGLHDWAGELDGSTDASVPDTWRPDRFGAIIAGRRTYDDSLPSWGADGPSLHRRLPVVVVTHRPDPQPPAGSVYTFVDDLDEAVREAKLRAEGKHVSVMGGGEIGGRMLVAGLLDEIKIHLVPVVLGRGTALFGGVVGAAVQLEPITVDPGRRATHLRFRVLG